MPLNITKHMNFSLSWEGVVSCGLVQLPGLALAILGVSKAINTHGYSCQALKNAFLASFFAFFPFFIVQLFGCLSFIFSFIIHPCCGLVFSQSVKKFAVKFDLLHFLLEKDKRPEAKLLALDTTKVFFGSSMQFIFQLYLVQNTDTVRLTQYLSICFSFLMICKIAFQINLYERKEIEDKDDEKSFAMKVMEELKQIPMKIWAFLLALPLLGSSVLFNLGSIHYMVQFFGYYTVIVIGFVFFFNLYATFWLENEDLENSESKIMVKLFISYSNIYFLSRPLEKPNDVTAKQTKLIQILRFIINFVFMSFYMIWIGLAGHYSLSDLFFPSLILCSGLVNICIVFQNDFQNYLLPKTPAGKEMQTVNVTTMTTVDWTGLAMERRTGPKLETSTSTKFMENSSN